MRVVSLIVMLALSFAAFFFIWPFVKDSVPPGIRRWVGVGIALVCVLPQVIFEVLYPKPFDITAYADSVDYEFASVEYAIEFAAENRDAAWVKVDGSLLDLAEDEDGEQSLAAESR
jgi:hypothetical protein